MPSSFKIGKIGGIEIGIHWSWIFIFLLLTWSFATGTLDHFFPNWSTAAKWIAGGATSLIFFVSLLLHELAHSFVAKSKGIEVRGITLFVLGGVSNLSREPRSAKEEFEISVVGPLTSLMLGGVFGLGWVVIRYWSPGIAGVSAQLAVINALIAAFNMLPGFPLDGGRVFRSIVWSRNRNMLSATRTASLVGEGVAYLLMGLGVIFFFFGLLIDGVWFFIIGLWLRGLSAASYQQMLAEVTLEGVTAGEAASHDCQSVPPDISIEQIVDSYVLSRNVRCFPVQSGDDLLGLSTLEDIRHVPRDQWPLTPISSTMTAFDRLHAVAPTEDLRHVLQVMAQADINQVPVVDGHRLIGLISRSDIIRLMQTRREMLKEH